MDTKLGGMPGVVRAWPISFRPPDRTTLWRWLNGKSQVAPKRILELAGAFDFDPFALFETTPRAYAVMCRALARSIGAKDASPLGSDLRWLRDFIAPNEEWPRGDLATKFFGRKWRLKHFSHTALERQNHFQKVSITAAPRKFAEPQVWHFAFRGHGPTFPLWTPYGFIERKADEIALYHFRGYSTTVHALPDARNFTVETWFGTAAAEFRVASLHKFGLVPTETADPSTPCVRFP